MIHHRGASLTEQQTDLLICHSTKQYSSLDRSSPEIVSHMQTARAATVSAATYTYMD